MGMDAVMDFVEKTYAHDCRGLQATRRRRDDGVYWELPKPEAQGENTKVTLDTKAQKSKR